MAGFIIEINVLLFVVLAVLSVLIITSNSFMIAVFAANSSLQDVTGYVMVSLAVADLGVGVSMATPLLYSIFSVNLSNIACDIMGFLNSVTWVVSVFNLMLLSIDRVIAIANPFHYKRVISMRLCITAIILAWLFSALLWLFPLVGYGSFKFNDEEVTCYFDVAGYPTQWIIYMAIIFVPTSVIIFISYTKIWLVFLKQKRQINAHLPQHTEGVQTSHKAIRTLVIIVCAFYVAWVPFVVEHIVKALQGSLENVPEWLEIAIYVLAASNSFWNPFIYVGTNKRFQRKSLEMLHRVCPCWNLAETGAEQSTMVHTHSNAGDGPLATVEQVSEIK